MATAGPSARLVALLRQGSMNADKLWAAVQGAEGQRSKTHMKALLQGLQQRGQVKARRVAGQGNFEFYVPKIALNRLKGD